MTSRLPLVALLLLPLVGQEYPILNDGEMHRNLGPVTITSKLTDRPGLGWRFREAAESHMLHGDYGYVAYRNIYVRPLRPIILR